jgi:hypothetical protein
MKLAKSVTQNTETVRDKHTTGNEETVEYKDTAKRKLDEVTPM